MHKGVPGNLGDPTVSMTESRRRVTANKMHPGVDDALPAVNEPRRNTKKEAIMVLQSERRA